MDIVGAILGICLCSIIITITCAIIILISLGIIDLIKGFKNN